MSSHVDSTTKSGNNVPGYVKYTEIMDNSAYSSTSASLNTAAMKEAEAGISLASSKDQVSESTDNNDNEKLPKRETWTNKIDFLLACIGFSVGLGNVWRFPYLCYKNGGGAFLLPYFICVIVGGIPMFFLEVAVGQFMSCGGIRAWNICPLFQGIGFATTVIVFFLNCYYNVILAWAFYYLFSSFTSILPWTSCDNAWNTCACKTSYGNATNITDIFSELKPECNGTDLSNITKFQDSVDEFWQLKVLQLSDGIDTPGVVKWDLALCLLLGWIVVYMCIWKGIKTSGKVMYFTATAPYILMTVLLIRGATLDGAIDGIKFYMTPNFAKLADMQVWVDAGTQIFFSYSISLGTLQALGSYNKFHHNSLKDSVIFACVNSGTSVFAGFVIFSVLGYMAKQQGVPVSDVAESGPGLAFIAYPKAISTMPVSPLWAILFFFMVILLGLDSQFVGVEGFITAITDIFPRLFSRKWYREIFIGIVCLFSFFVGLTMVTEGGMYVFQLMDFYSGSRIILLVALFECIAVGWVYGVNRFDDNLAMMYGFRIPFPIFKVAWCIITPLFTIVMFIMSGITYSELTYNRTYEYPKWAIGIGWMMAVSSIVFVPIMMVVKISLEKGTFYERIQKLIRPRLNPHQLRPEDDLADLNSEVSDDYASPEDASPSDSKPTLSTSSSTVVYESAI